MRWTFSAALFSVMMVASIVTPAAAMAATGPDECSACFERRVERIGTSASGAPISVVVRGRGDADIDVLVVGAIHGSERAGMPIVARLQRTLPPRRVRYWLLPALNVDGVRRGSRQNARGVDLNRNFPYRWRGGGRAFDVYYPGRARASEPETRAMLRLVRRVRPDVTIWYHQHARMVIRPQGRWRQALARTYERASGLAMRDYPVRGLRGTAATWQEAEQRRSLALVVELPAGRLARAAEARHADAVRRTAIAAIFDGVRAP
jgi:protein MpaA